MTAEQAKAESTQRSVEEGRRAASMQINMEREELERAKVRLMNLHISTGGGHWLYLSACLLFPSEHTTGGAEVSNAAMCRGKEEAGN